jgi:hypothetical protein
MRSRLQILFDTLALLPAAPQSQQGSEPLQQSRP